MPGTPKGLVTVAFLKTQLDQNRDHLGLFEPLVADGLSAIKANEFGTSEMRDTVCDRTGLVLPLDTLQTVLGRFVKRGALKRTGGRYFKTGESAPDLEFASIRKRIEHEQEILADALISFAKAESVEFSTRDEALAALAAFVSDNKVHLMLQAPLPDSPLDRSSQGRRVTRTVARFISKQCMASEQLRPALDGLVEGIIIEDTLLLRDIRDSARLFSDFTAVLDTPLLFPALQMSGVASAVAVREGLHLLRQAGAKTVAFDITVDEMRRILAVYEARLGTSAGRIGLYPTELSRYVLSQKMTPADIRLISSTLEARLSQAGIAIRPVPARDARYTLDEAALAKALVDQRSPDPDSPRVRHDVDVVAGVLTIRAGHSAGSLEESRALFVTTSGKVVRNTQAWFATQEEGGTPPIVHHLALTSIAWLKKPSAAPAIKLHELAAICVAALRPTRETWGKVLDTLKRLTADGVFTDDEAVSVVVSDLIEPSLSRLDDETEPDADSIIDAIDRVRESYRREAAASAGVVMAEAESKILATREEAAAATAKAEADTKLAQETAAAAMKLSDDLVARLDERARRIARGVATTICIAAALVVVAAAVLSLPGVLDAVSPKIQWISRALLTLGALFGVYSALTGGSVAQLHEKITGFFSAHIKTAWFGQSG